MSETSDEHEMKGHCELCDEWLPLRQLSEHLHRYHPHETQDGFDTWPDGKPVVIDLTLEPEDFNI